MIYVIHHYVFVYHITLIARKLDLYDPWTYPGLSLLRTSSSLTHILPQFYPHLDLNLLDFKLFIEEVNDLKEILINSSGKNKHYHPMFGDITTKDWIALTEIHMSHHNKQKDRITNFLESR